MAVVLLIIGAVMAIALPMTGAYLDNSYRSKTTTTLQAVQTALVNFATQNGRLPCPADGAIPDGAVGAGVEARNAAGDCLVTAGGAIGQVRGVVPWVTLGLATADALDGWNNRITYRVTAEQAGINLGLGLTRAGALNMTGCDAAGAAAVNATNPISCVAGCAAANLGACTSALNFVLSRGLQLSDGAGNCLLDPFAATPTGAAYVLISHGTNRAGAYTSTGALVPAAGAVPAPSVMELTNANGNALKTPLVACGGAYINAQFVEGAVATHFDDIVLSQTVISLINAAQLGPRAH